ncbi:tRNA pseudouridine(55) synthase TruB [Prochlorococcus sp. MIT 0916]|uniref:tRNA pseudouridine(55) synthase TruB n=1 Tax=Prochlorococcus sp. MIT 0916 TaxID=3082521 RepID=UPI0039B3A701
MEKPFGFVVIDKPAGLTSHDCVNRLRKVFGIRKIGHSGTLDPLVTGVLPIAIGNATRLISYLQGTKAYTGIIQLGTTTNTDDIQGEILETRNWPSISENDINSILENFRGDILQKPPIFSSVHIKGERAYKKARKGEKFDLIPKKVTIKSLNLISWSQNKGELFVEVECTTGTYIRSLARDIGNKIGCGGYLKKLRRTKAYNFNENHLVILPKKAGFYLEENKPKVLEPNIFFNHLSSFELISEEEIISWRSGRKISFQDNIKRLKIAKSNETKDGIIHTKNILVLDKKNKILGIADLDKSHEIKPKVVFDALG